jgi:hypothetical protein
MRNDISTGQQGIKNYVSAIKVDIKSNINDICAGQDEMKHNIHNKISAIQDRISASQAEFEEMITDTLDKQLNDCNGPTKDPETLQGGQQRDTITQQDILESTYCNLEATTALVRVAASCSGSLNNTSQRKLGIQHGQSETT